MLALTDADVVEPEPATGKSSRRSLRAHTSASRSPPPVADRTAAAVGASAVKTTLSPPQAAVLTGGSLPSTWGAVPLVATLGKGTVSDYVAAFERRVSTCHNQPK